MTDGPLLFRFRKYFFLRLSQLLVAFIIFFPNFRLFSLISLFLLAVQGNAAYKDKQWQKAASFYSEAIKLSGKNPTYYSNRAAAYLETGRYPALLTRSHFIVSSMIF